MSGMNRNLAEITTHIPVIALTTSALTEDRELVLAHGINAFIAIPVDESIFFSTIKKDALWILRK